MLATGTHVLIRVKSDIPLRRAGGFAPDGSYLAELSGGGVTLTVRVIEYTVSVAGRDAPEMFCLISDLTDHTAYPAGVLARRPPPGHPDSSRPDRGLRPDRRLTAAVPSHTSRRYPPPARGPSRPPGATAGPRACPTAAVTLRSTHQRLPTGSAVTIRTPAHAEVHGIAA
jgi:hypothetical protein